MKKLIEKLINKRWLIVAIFAIVALTGIYSWSQLALDAYPDIADVTVQVVTQVPGLAAEEIEQQITIPLERALNGMPNLSVMRSNNTFGISTIILVFEDGTDDYWARQRVTERISDVDLPYGATPELNPITSPTGEIYRYVLVGNSQHSLRELTELNKWVVIPRLTQITGVADVSNYGGITTQFQLETDPELMEKYNVSLSEITEALERNNTNAGGSILVQGDLGYVVRGVGLIRDLDDMGNIVVKSINGIPIYIKDLGELKYGNLERKGVLGYRSDNFSTADGVEGIVQMLRYENPSKVLKSVHSAVDDLNNNVLPEGVRIEPFLDRTSLVETTLHTVLHTLLFGMLLVVTVLLVFLRSMKSALLVAITIPMSLLVAFILMHFTNIPANLLSLGAIDFGILVDGAIVMVETILKQRESAPDDELDFSNTVKSVSKVAKPIFFATLIIIMAYMPLFAFQRIERKLFTPMAFTIGYALIGALLCSLVLIPGLAFAIYKKPQKIRRNSTVERLTEKYKQHTSWIVCHPKKLIAPMAAVLTTVIILCITVGKDFLPQLDEGGIWMQVQAPYGISLQRSAEYADTLRNRLKSFPEVTYVMTQTGRDDEGTEAFTPSHIECSVGLKPYKEWKRGKTKQDLIDEMTAMIDTMPGYSVGFSQPIIDMVMDQMAGSHSDLAVKIYGEDQNQSRLIAEQVVSTLKSIDGANDVMIDQEPPLPQLRIDIDRAKVAQYGLNIADVSELVEVAIGGKAISQIYSEGKVHDITCRYKEDSRNTQSKIGQLMLTNSDGVKVPLAGVSDIKTSLGASTLSRESNKRYLTVRVNLRGRDLTSFLDEAQSKIEENIEYDHTVNQIKWDGQYKNQQRAYNRLLIVMPFVLALMCLLMYGAFGKWRQSAMLMSLLPFALFGGMAALNIRGMSFNVSSAVGFIALFGLTIQNGIIMVSHINNLRSEGMDLRQSVISGAIHRFRPVLMTASVAILGLLPASLATGIGSDVQRPLATVIVYGLLCSTIITLYVLPCLYYTIEKRKI